jgi:hypothetical protein
VCFDFHFKFFWNIFPYNKKWGRYDKTSSHSVRVIVKLYNSFSTLSQKRHVLRKKVFENEMCVLIFSTTFFWNVFHYNKKWARYGQTSSRRLRVIVKLYNSFRHYLINGTFYEKMALIQNVEREFLYNVFLTFFIIIRNERDMINNLAYLKDYCQVVQ